MKLRTIAVYGIFFLFTSALWPLEAQAATIKLRVMVVNPSTSKTQTTTIKTYLPKEVKAEDIKDAAGLDVEYDSAQASFFVFKDNVELAPSETKTFEVIIEDVWRVPDEKIEQYKRRTDAILKHLQDTPYFTQASLLGKTIYGRLDDISRTQNDTAVTRQQHIAYFRDNVKLTEGLQHDIDELEKLVVAVGGPPNLELVEKSDVNLKSPSSKTTWIIIFVIMIFIAILGLAFYFTWQSQAKVSENIFTKEKESAFSEFKRSSGGGPEPPKT